MDTVHTAPPRPVARPRVVPVGSALVSVGVLMFFAGLFGIYLSLQGVPIPLQPPTVMVFTLLLSCFTVQWAFYAVARNDRVNAYVALGLTLLLGGAVINAQFWLYQQMGLVIAESVQAVLIYAISGAFLALLLSAMAYLLVVTFRTLGGQYGPHQHGGIAGATLYWYVMVAVFAVIWYAIYITK
jgi:cytochrome c oxidase subunit 3